MACLDKNGTNILAGMRVNVESGAHYAKRPKVTAVGSSTVTLNMGIGAGISGAILRVLEHYELGPTTGLDWASTQ